jgi:lantibiotic modifying enzyme
VRAPIRILGCLLGYTVLALAGCRATAERPSELRSVAEDAARWIEGAARRSEDGTRWPADPALAAAPEASLYSGSSGVVLFLLRLHAATGDRAALAQARAGAAALVADLEALPEAGLYTGVAGVGATLLELWRVTGEARDRDAVLRCVRVLEERSHAVGAGVEWSPTTDVIAGGAGIGLFLLAAARELDEAAALELARRAGLRLLELARAEAHGLSWAMDPDFPRRMPNFSHGTAGVAYFLARLFEETGEERFLAAARAGAEHLLAIADTAGDACRVYHHEPDGLDLFYLGWCHGPVGTARLFFVLHRITGEEAWWTWVRRSACAIETSGIPEATTPGFWDNAGLCCGLAGVAELFLDLHRARGEPADLAFSRRVTRTLLARATRDALGTRWIQAEHRVRPDERAAQTGWMQGAAGIGAWLLELDAFERGCAPRPALPDSPFGPER